MEYTDVEARIRALEVEHDTLLSILEKCERLEDVITVQSRITEVQYQLDSYQSRLRRYDDLISYCTVYLSVNEVERVTVPPAELTLGERIREDLAENCAEIAEDAEDFAVWFVSSLPFLGIWIVVIGGVVLVALEFGFIQMYRAGWPVSMGALTNSIVLAVVLALVGVLLYREVITLRQIAGMAVCAAGLILLSK